MFKFITGCVSLFLTLVLIGLPYIHAESLSNNFRVYEDLLVAKAEQNYLVKMQGIRNGKQETKSANIWASSQEEAISKAIKTWEQNSFQNIKIVEVKKLN